MSRHPDIEYAEHVDQVRARMHTAFQPETDDELLLVGWLFGMLDPSEADVFSAMVERRAET